ncbi:MAG TPA: transglycosylase domain-containing protein [Acidimicrobiales bacterium]|nr:transglycosylase domain-containing protein [Acidimicrobiales bacterium]
MRRPLSRLPVVIVAAGLVLALAAGTFTVPYRMLSHVGKGEPRPLALRELAQRSYVYDARGGLVAALSDEENRQPVPLSKVPRHVVDAILAVEDAGFWIHEGYDVRGMLRALRANVDAGGISQGGSTITQQLVKLDLLSREQTLERKVQEIVLAQRLEKQMSKREILDRYLSTVYFGNHAYGVQAAAETYFGVGVEQLDVGQAALLAGIIRNPVSYDPVRHPERAAARRDVALERMLDAGWLTDEEHAWWQAAPTVPSYHQVLPRPDDYFPAAVKDAVLNDPEFAVLGDTKADRYRAVFQGGLRIRTTFDPKAQAQAIAARDAVLPLEGGVFTQPGVNPATGEPNRGSAAVVSIEPSSGAVRTMVGGPGFEGYKWNLATQNARGVGSSFKTFVLATVMDQGHSPDDIVNGTAPCAFLDPNEEGGIYDVTNFADGGGSVGTVTAATLASSNCAYVRLGLIAGMPKVAEMAYRLGIPRDRGDPDGDGRPNPTICATCKSSALGVASITPLEMASAYATLANDGVRNRPYLVERIEDRNGRVLYQHRKAPERSVAPETARLVNGVLQQNVLHGTGTRAQVPGQPSAGKTGTNQNSTDAWFVGYTPALATAVWVGGLGWNYEIRLGGSPITGGRYPAAIWGTFMRSWQQGRPRVDFPPAAPRPGGKVLVVPGGVDLSPPIVAPPPPPPPGPTFPPGPRRLPAWPGFPPRPASLDAGQGPAAAAGRARSPA